MMTTETQASETTVDDHLRNLIQLMKRGARLKLSDLPDDPSFLSSNIGGGMSQAIAERLEAALSAAEPAHQDPDPKISQQELAGFFPDGAPLAVVKFLYPEFSKALTREEIRYFLRAIAAPPAPSVAVQALEWFSHQQYVLADTAFGTYRVLGDTWWFENGKRNRAKNVEEAKAAAQDDYEARIRSALSAQVQDVAGMKHVGWRWKHADTPEDGHWHYVGGAEKPDPGFTPTYAEQVTFEKVYAPAAPARQDDRILHKHTNIRSGE